MPGCNLLFVMLILKLNKNLKAKEELIVLERQFFTALRNSQTYTLLYNIIKTF